MSSWTVKSFSKLLASGGLKAIALALAVLGAMINREPVLAHATLIRSDPADSAVLEAAPSEMSLWFSEEIVGRFSTVRLLDGKGQPVANLQVAPHPAEPNRLGVTAPALPPGVYSAIWRVLSQADGHFSQGLLIFGVGEGANLGAAVVSAPEFSPPLPEVLLRWLHFTLLAGIVGAVVVVQLVLIPLSRQWVGSQNSADWRDAIRRLLYWVCGSAGFAFVIGIALLGWQIVLALESSPPETSFLKVGWLLLNQTRWGQLWLARQALLMLLGWIGFWQAQTKPEYLRVAVLLLCPALLAVQALSGHAAGDSSNWLLPVAVDTLHLLAASVWIGGLGALAIGLLPLVRQGRTVFMTMTRPSLLSFSPLAAVSVGVLIATGLYSMGQQIASVDALITTGYGQVVLGKIALVLIAGLFGLLNRRLLQPGREDLIGFQKPVRSVPEPRKLRQPLLAEIGVGSAILLATSWITATPPPRGAEFTVVPEEIPATLSQTVDDLVVTLEVKPNRPGQNVFNVRSASTRRPPPAAIDDVLLRFSSPDQVGEGDALPAQEVEPGRYLLMGDALKVAGAWQIEVITQRDGLADSAAHFTWTVAPPGATRPLVLSKAPWKTPLTLVAAGILLLLALSNIGVRRRTAFVQPEVTP